MWPFPPKTAPPTDAGLTARLEKLERQVEALDLEWSEWFDKYRRLYARIAKRVERDSDSGQESSKDARHATNSVQGNTGVPPRPLRNLRGF